MGENGVYDTVIYLSFYQKIIICHKFLHYVVNFTGYLAAHMFQGSPQTLYSLNLIILLITIDILNC